MIKKDIISMYQEAKEKITKEREGGKFRNPRNKDKLEQMIHEGALNYLLRDADKKMTMDVIRGIVEGSFSEKNNHISAEINVLNYIIRDSINDETVVSASFKAMKTMLENTTNDITSGNKNETLSKVDSMQEILCTISDLRESYPNKLGKQTDSIYETYKKMMKECSLSGLYNELQAKDHPKISDYYHGIDAYKEVKELETIHRQENIAWETKEQVEAAKERISNKMMPKIIADYEKRHAEQVKKEDAQYKQELNDFVESHVNRVRSKEHQKQIDEIKLKHSDKLLGAAYENFKDVAREPDNEENAKNVSISRNVPKHAAFIARIENKRQA